MAVARQNARDLARVWNDGAAPKVAVSDSTIPVKGAVIELRHYRPPQRADRSPALIYAHGGGWIVGDLDIEDLKLRKLASATQTDIFSVDYRLAPENPHPTPQLDLAAATRHVIDNAARLDVRADKIALGGASAGAHLALATALTLRREGVSLAALVLFYGVFDLRFGSESFKTRATGFGLETRAMQHFRALYCGEDETKWSDPAVSPLLADLSGLPPVFINAVTHDPLFSDSMELAERLKQADVPVEVDAWQNTIHGFTAMSAIMPHADIALQRAADWLSRQLSDEDSRR